MHVMIVRARLALALLVVSLAATAMLLPASASAKDSDELTVLTRNLYLGSSLDPALTAGSGAAFIGGVAQIYGTVQFTDFPTRAGVLADEIKATDADIVGLQEVSKWTTFPSGLTPLGTPPAGYDFLEILNGALAARGLDYAVASVSNNADITAPLVTLSGCGIVSASPPFSNCLVRLQDRDVILVNRKRSALSYSNPQSGLYGAQATATTPVGPLSFDRGWASIDGKLSGEPFRFVNTHLETEAAPPVQVAQGNEFLAGPANAKGKVIATGDFNSAADGSNTATYANLTGVLNDAWSVNGSAPGLTCCENQTLTSYPSELDKRIDLVLSNAKVNTVSASVVGNSPFRTPGAYPFWASDHAGVVATLRLR